MFVKEITKRYDGKAVVDGVSFEIPKGKVLSSSARTVRENPP